MATASQTDCQRDLNLCGLSCPLPILRTKQALRDMQVGERVRVQATDPHSVIDFQGFCDTTAHTLIAQSEADGVYTFCIEKGA
jgi:tRNA 2-thiouridine synthesizing protein A